MHGSAGFVRRFGVDSKLSPSTQVHTLYWCFPMTQKETMHHILRLCSHWPFSMTPSVWHNLTRASGPIALAYEYDAHSFHLFQQSSYWYWKSAGFHAVSIQWQEMNLLSPAFIVAQTANQKWPRIWLLSQASANIPLVIVWRDPQVLHIIN